MEVQMRPHKISSLLRGATDNQSPLVPMDRPGLGWLWVLTLTRRSNQGQEHLSMEPSQRGLELLSAVHSQ